VCLVVGLAVLLGVLLASRSTNDSSSSGGGNGIPVFGGSTTNGDDYAYMVGPFQASYYQEQDGDEFQQGNDGTDPHVNETFVTSETNVDYPALYHAENEIFGIPAKNLKVVWEGPIYVAKSSSSQQTTTIEVAFAVDYADVAFYVDNTLQSRFSSNTVVPLTLQHGSTYNIKIEYHNHWLATSFLATMTNYPDITITTATDILTLLLAQQHDDDSSTIVYVGAKHSASRDQTITVMIPNSYHPCLVFLASFHGVRWIIETSVEILAVAVDAYDPAFTVSFRSNTDHNNHHAPIYHVTDMRSRWDENAVLPRYGVPEMTGREVDYEFYQQAPSVVTIPDL
jgi:hypothetical protein